MIEYRVNTVFYTKRTSRAKHAIHYIPCGIIKGCNICRHSYNTLNVYIPSSRTAKRLLSEYPEIFKPFQVGDNEATLLFSECKMDEAAVILRARVKGKNMNPKPKRNAISQKNKGRQ